MSADGGAAIPGVGILARIVPHGIERRDDGYHGLATLVLMPLVPDAADASAAGSDAGNAFPLSAWPTEVDRALKTLKMNVGRVARDPDVLPKPPGPGSTESGVALTRSVVRSQASLDAASQLWVRLMDQGSAHGWSALAEALRARQSPDSLNQLHCGGGDGGAAPAGGTGAGTAPDPEPRHPDVFAYPRADAALLYGFERAREVLRSMKQECHSCKVAAATIRTGGRRIDAASFTFGRKPWLGLDAPPIRLARNGDSDVPLGTSGLGGFALRDKALTDERHAQEEAYRRQLAEKSQQAKKLADGRRAYLNAPTPSARAAALARQAPQRATSLPPSACSDACGPTTDDSIAQNLTDHVKATQSLGSLPDVDDSGDVTADAGRGMQDAFEAAAETAAQRIYAINGMPSLARMLNFVVDVEFRLDDLLSELKLTEQSALTDGFREWGVIDHFADLTGTSTIPPRTGCRDDAHYLFVSVALAASPRQIWTLAKFRMPRPEDPNGEAGHFWPCTREELDLRLADIAVREAVFTPDRLGADIRGSCAVFQFDGVVDLGVTACDDTGVRNPRYDIVSLDTISTVESDIQVDRRMKSRSDAAAQGAAVSGDLGAQTRRTGGFALLDRWRQDHVVSQIVTALHRFASKAAIVLDAEDLTAGYRLDVGILPSSSEDRRRIWRSLMNRTMEFGTPADALDQHIEELYGWPDPHDLQRTKERRRRADSASLSLASRLKSNGAEREDRASTTVFAEEIMIAWHGDPLGLDCVNPHELADGTGDAGRGAAGIRMQDDGMSMPAEHLPLDIRYGLETGLKAYKPPPLRYGRRYHFGLRPVYLGGIVLPLELAISRYERNFDLGSALPAPNVENSAGRRFLRHERIEAPLLTVPAALAADVFKYAPDLDSPLFDRASIETGATCLLRTSLRITGAKFPDTTRRILVPPIVPLEQAALHGVFDKASIETVVFKDPCRPWPGKKDLTLVRPVDGLKALDFSGDLDPETGTDRGGFPHYLRRTPAAGEPPRGPAVFRLRPDSRPRHVPFYPDPAADMWVVAARRPHSSDYLCGPVTIDTTMPGITFPNVLPVVVEVRKRTSRRPKPACEMSDLVESQTLARVDADGSIGHSGLPVIHLVLALDPGEDFELEIWCAPAEATLRRRFDIVESLAVLMARDSATEGFAEGRLDEACLDSLKAHFPEFKDAVEERRGTGKPNLLCGPAGMTLPRADVLDLVAKAIAHSLKERSIPELAATTLLRITHAVDLPNQKPVLCDDLRLTRLRPETMGALFAPARSDAPGATDKASRLLVDRARWESLADDGATNAIFGGTIEADLLTTQDIVIRAAMVSPTSAVFDDPKRGRTGEERMRGAYRPPGTVRNLASVEPWPKLQKALINAGALCEADSLRLFGFVVAADGRVSFRPAIALLTLLHDLPEIALSDRASWLHPRDLVGIQRTAYQHDRAIRTAQPPDLANGTPPSSPIWEDTADRPGRVQYVQPFHDGLARRLEVKAVAASRFVNLFPPQPEPVADPSADPAALQEAARRQQDHDRKFTDSDTVSIWLPATRRPDRLPARSLRPSFTWATPPAPDLPSLPRVGGRRRLATAVRTCSIHVPFARPHFTSGEGERVGVVIWPPDLLDGATEAGAIPKREILADRVRRDGQPRQSVRLDSRFSDSDLGPGGQFVTRWGADPIRQGPRPGGWLIPAEAFVDWDPASSGAVRFMPNVLMPIPREQSDPSKESDAASREFMLVSLLTYEAKFDIDGEHWFIDVGIDTDVVPEPFIRLGLVRFQAHARRELQCSEPIAEWVQVMPRRQVCVDLDETMARSGLLDLVVEVSSPARYDSRAPLQQIVPDGDDGSDRVPIMRATVLRNDTSADGTSAIQTIVPPNDSVAADSTVLDMRRTGEGTVWSGPITVAHRPPPGAISTYALYLEEVEIFQSTSNPTDPATGKPRAGKAETGPRFAAIVDLPLPPMQPNPKPPPPKPPPHKPTHPPPHASKHPHHHH